MQNMRFKGTRDGLIALLPEGPQEWAVDELIGHMNQNRHFFDGMDGTLYVAGLTDAAALARAQALLAEKFHIADVRGGESYPSIVATQSVQEGLPVREAVLKTVEGTVRNGQRIAYQGDILVLGDVNPGAVLIAGGNVYVMGTLRGLAHAGAYGDEGCIVLAMVMQPMQLRIAQCIARPPEHAQSGGMPEVARIWEDRIEIIPYTQLKLGGAKP